MRFSSAVVVLGVLGFVGACDSGGPGAVGAPCNTADDCEDGLICDEHDGQASCQQPHSHGETGEDETTASEPTTSAGTTGMGPTSGTAEATTDHGETGPAETSSGSSGGESSTGTDNELCEAFCGCMNVACSEYDAYPYADNAACMAACERFESATLQCFGGFCQQAMDTEGTLAEHYCEHAWGALGNEKC